MDPSDIHYFRPVKHPQSLLGVNTGGRIAFWCTENKPVPLNPDCAFSVVIAYLKQTLNTVKKSMTLLVPYHQFS